MDNKRCFFSDDELHIIESALDQKLEGLDKEVSKGNLAPSVIDLVIPSRENIVKLKAYVEFKRKEKVK